jgi:ribonuclease HI
VEVNGTKSNTFYLNEGLPQGSSISPILFLIFINDITTEDTASNSTPSLFADDTAVWISVGKDRAEAKRKMQAIINGIQTWSEKWKMSLNQGKTETMIISSSNADLQWEPALFLKGTRVKIVKEYKFLGVTIDGGLHFNTHVNRLVSKCKKRSRILKCLAGKDWGQNLETQRALYSTYIRSALEYASPSWWPCISETNKTKLQRVQNDCLRSMARLAKTCPTDFLHTETGIEPLRDRMRKNGEIMWERYARLRANDPRRQLKEKEVKQRLQSRYGWRCTTKPQMESTEALPRDIPSVKIHPWSNINATITSVQLETNKADYKKEELKQETIRKIKEVNADILIFTDGSTSEKQENGGAGVFILDREGNTLHEESYPAGKLCSSYDAECVAMLRSIVWIKDHGGTSRDNSWATQQINQPLINTNSQVEQQPNQAEMSESENQAGLPSHNHNNIFNNLFDDIPEFTINNGRTPNENDTMEEYPDNDPADDYLPPFGSPRTCSSQTSLTCTPTQPEILYNSSQSVGSVQHPPEASCHSQAAGSTQHPP